MSAGARTGTAGASAPGFDPFRSLWKLLTNTKFALTMVGILALACLAGVIIPQLPAEMRDNPAGRSAWIELRREDYGLFTDLMVRGGLFEVFRSWWFNGLWLVVLFAMTVCTVSRIRPVARNVHRPPRRVNERYFETAHHRATLAASIAPEDLEASLSRRRYRVERIEERGGATLLFADRFPWSQYGTFVSHLALLLFLVGGILTRFAGFDRTLVAAELAPPAPVFGGAESGQIFVTMTDAVRRLDPDGNIVDFRSQIEVRRGEETISCTTTVNDPCHAFGYSIHQAAFIDDLARLHIEDSDGRTLYDDLVDFRDEKTIVPHLRVSDSAGTLLFDQTVPQVASQAAAEAGERPISLSDLTFPAASGSSELVQYAVAWTVTAGEVALTVGGPDLGTNDLRPGERVTSAAGYTIEFVTAAAIPAITLLDMPGSASEEGALSFQLLEDRAGRPYLFLSGAGANRAIPLGESREAGGHSFRFDGRAEASGLSVKRDPGDLFIWIAVGLATIGLAITFYVPRRRLWARITPGRADLAGIADRTTRFEREMQAIGAELGVPLPIPDDEDAWDRGARARN